MQARHEPAGHRWLKFAGRYGHRPHRYTHFFVAELPQAFAAEQGVPRDFDAQAVDLYDEGGRAVGSLSVRLAGNSAEIIALIPGARWDNKRWPPGHFASAVGSIAKQKPTARFVIIGGSGDRELAREINSLGTVACLDLTGRTSIPEMIECLRRCRLVITNDTGPMHIIAATGWKSVR